MRVNLLFEDQPANRIPSTPIDETAIRKKNADIEVDNLQTVAPRKHRESKHRSDDYQVRREGEKEAVDMVEMNNLFNEHLEHIGEALAKPIGPTRFGPRRH